MSTSFTSSNTHTFTVTNAKYIASKVATDLKRIQRFYNTPSDNMIDKYEQELVVYLKNGFLTEITYGFLSDEDWINPTLRYTPQDFRLFSERDDDPGKVRPGENIQGAYFTSFLISNSRYANVSAAQQEAFIAALPFNRTEGESPGSNGYFSNDLIYSSGGRSLNRSSLKK